MAVNQLSRFMASPSQAHMAAARHVLRYLRGTSDLQLYYSASTLDTPRPTPPDTLVGFADASWGSVQPSNRSVSGYVFMLNNAAVSWRCKVQHCVALSTAEAEFLSLCEAAREAIYLRNLLADLQLPQSGPTVVLEDNQPCIHLVRNPVTTNRSKHIAIRFNFTRDQVTSGVLDIVYCPTADMAADLFTKILARPQHFKLAQFVFGSH